jgi:hypothetical protein
MKRYLAAFALASLFPLSVCAASSGIPAGFAPTSVFASKTSITEGDTISLFTVLYNQSVDDISGDVVFTVDGQSAGTKHFSLQSGETQTPSVTWSAVRGSHQASAHIENIVGSDGSISLLNDKADTITITVAAPAPPSATAAAVQNVTQALQSAAQSAAPAAQSAFNSLENIRQSAVTALADQLAAASPASSTARKGSVLGAETYRPDTASGTTTSGGTLNSIWRAVLQGLLFVCSIRALFYLVLLFVVFLLYKLMRAFFAERSH